MKINKLNVIFPLVFLLMSCAPKEMKKTEVSLASDLVMRFWDNYEPGSSEMYTPSASDNCYPEPFVLKFDKKDGVLKRVVNLSLKEDMSDAEAYTSTKSTISIDNLFSNTSYFMRVDEYDGDNNVIEGEVEQLITLDYPRTFKIPSVSNVRDIGGRIGSGGKKIAQGKIYRGAHLNDVTEESKSFMVHKLHINLDLDLRATGEGGAGTVSPLGDIKYQNIPGVYYVEGSSGIKNQYNLETIRNEIKVFADPSNYPIYMHCAIGRDRTGTLAIILQSLLGVDAETILKDYELSFFSKICNVDGFSPANASSAASSIMAYITMNFSDEEMTLEGSTRNWLTKEVGVSEEEIEAIRNIMLL